MRFGDGLKARVRPTLSPPSSTDSGKRKTRINRPYAKDRAAEVSGHSSVTPVHTTGNALVTEVVNRTLSPWHSHGAIVSTPLHPYAKNQHFLSRYNVGRIRTDVVCRLVADMDGLEMSRTETLSAKVLIGPVTTLFGT
jgi:hypothetical protein